MKYGPPLAVSRSWVCRQPTRLQLQTKLRLYQTCILSSLLYGSETWTLLQEYLRKLEVFHMRSQRMILGIHWYDFVRNTEVVDRTNLGIGYRRSGSKTRMMGIPGRQRSLTISSTAVWIECTNVIDSQTDGRTDGQTPGDSKDRPYA